MAEVFLGVGVLGGTFNPIHYGHLRSAEEVREALGLEEVRFIPLAHPPHKSETDIAPARARLEMVGLAIQDNPAFVCDSLEVERGGISYTVDTLQILTEGSCRGREMFFIVGADAFAEFHTWRRPSQLLRMANFAVTLRMGQRAEEAIEIFSRRVGPLDPSLSFRQIGEYCIEIIDYKTVIKYIPILSFGVSGTEIRKRAARGCSLRYLLPPPVELFIIQRRLYS